MKQLSVFMNNEIGSLAKITTVIRENGINIRAISAFDSPDFGILRVIVDKSEEAKSILASKGFAVKSTEVLAVELEDRPGALDEMLNLIASNGLNMNYIYSFVLRQNNEPLMVINVDNMEQAIHVLKENNIQVME